MGYSSFGILNVHARIAFISDYKIHDCRLTPIFPLPIRECIHAYQVTLDISGSPIESQRGSRKISRVTWQLCASVHGVSWQSPTPVWTTPACRSQHMVLCVQVGITGSSGIPPEIRLPEVVDNDHMSTDPRKWSRVGLCHWMGNVYLV